jgi:precorrin-2 dehydrogenase/sirohydrochlorin ferrochelatase
LVLGGDEEAAEKVQRLLDAGAKVTVISPSLNDALRKLAASAKIIHRGRLFRASDADGVVLVINTLKNDPAYSKSLLELARKERFLLWSADEPECSTVMMPAVVQRGHLRVAISTSGVAPGLAGRLRQDLQEVFNDEFVEFLQWLEALRKTVQEEEPQSEQRRRRLRDAVDGFRLTGTLQYPQAWVEERQRRDQPS